VGAPPFPAAWRVEGPRGQASPPWRLVVIGAGLLVVSVPLLLPTLFLVAAARRSGVGLGLPRPGLESLPAALLLIFLCAGVALVLGGLWRALADWRRRAAFQPAAPWLTDHPWRRDGAVDETSGEGRRVLRLAAVVLAGLALTAWVLLGEASGPALAVMVMLFGLLVVGAAALALSGLRSLRRAWQQRGVRLRFARLPFLLGERVDVALVLPRPLASPGPLHLQLRYVEERVRDERGLGTSLVHERWALVVETREVALAAGIDRVPLRFDLSENPGQGTALSARPPRYWELAAVVPGAGVDAVFLLPVYGPAQADARPAPPRC
jgi:hypothetical protein